MPPSSKQELRCLFDFPLNGQRQPLAFTAPQEILVATTPDEVRPVLRSAEARACAGAWVAGFVSYDAAPAFDTAFRIPIPDKTTLPLAWFAVFDAPTPPPRIPDSKPITIGPWQPAIDRARFDADLAHLRQRIREGDAYQINHTLRLHADCKLDADETLDWFATLQRAQPHGYCAWLDIDDAQILSLSPELFFRRDGDIVTTRPMKGTASRGRWTAEDRQRADWLRQSEKNRAENLMIVDLLRNDLSRIARPHSVCVSDMFAIEHHPTVWQMTSTVRATARPGTTLDDLFGALFPCGSVTGAPKAKAMELIAALEDEPRGIYCGAIGLLKPGGDAVFNVAIRTVAIHDGRATCGVGGGIVWDSTAGDEYAEAMLKARFLDASSMPEDFDLFETLRLEHGQYWLLQRHLDRLAGSAEYFGFSCDLDACRRQLDALARQHDNTPQPLRVRLNLDRSGRIEITATPMPDTPLRPTFALAHEPVPSHALWLHHKTTYRAVYDRALAAQPDAFDVLLWNERNELTEFTRGNLVLELDGKRYTPPLDCGLLDGVLRRELLDTGQIQERILTQSDLACAERIFFINSLRGEIEIDTPLPAQS